MTDEEWGVILPRIMAVQAAQQDVERARRGGGPARGGRGPAPPPPDGRGPEGRGPEGVAPKKRHQHPRRSQRHKRPSPKCSRRWPTPIQPSHKLNGK